MENTPYKNTYLSHTSLRFAPDIVFIADHNGHIIFTNDYAPEICGYSTQELLGMSAFDLAPEDWRGIYRKRMEQVIADGKRHVIEVRMITKAGVKIPMELSVVQMPNGQLYGTCRDITERKLATAKLTEAYQDLSDLIATIPDPIFFKDGDGRWLITNKPAQDLFDLHEIAWQGKTDMELAELQPELRTAYENCVRDDLLAWQKGDLLVAEEIVSNTSGEARTMEVLKMPRFSEENQRKRLVIIGRDITERCMASAKIHEVNKDLATLLETIPDAIIYKDGEGRWLSANEPALQLFHLKNTAWQGKTNLELLDIDPALREVQQSCLLSDEQAWQSGELCNFNEQLGMPRRDFEVRKLPQFDAQGRRSRLLTICRDVTQLNESKQRIHELAFYDPVTHLPNRTLLLDRIQQACAASAHSKFYGAVLSLELDSFKTISSDLGEKLSIEVGRCLASCIQEGETLANLGGDSFVIVMESLSANLNDAAEQAQLFAEKICDVVNQAYQLQTLSVHANLKIGIALLLSHEETAEELLRQSKSAQAQAKKSGRNAIHFYNPVIQASLIARNKLEHELILALEQQQFQLFYQIQMDSQHRALGCEVLLRWQHPSNGTLEPTKFIPLCEETGLIIPLGLWVLEQACRQLKSWQKQVHLRDLKLAVNVSAKQFQQQNFVMQVQRILMESGAKASQLKLELTESSMLDNVEDTIAKMRELKLLGIGFSMDDFGTGHSSLQYLKRLPLDQIKIDQSFVRDITTDINDAVIVKTIISMSDAMGLSVIAEGVETQAQRDFLEQHGCHQFQGYLFGKPLPLDEFEKTLLAKLS